LRARSRDSDSLLALTADIDKQAAAAIIPNMILIRMDASP